MPHVEPLSLETAPEESQAILKKIESKFGHSFNLFNTLAYQSQVLEGVTKINDGMQRDLPAQLRELAYYKASRINQCDYCGHYHEQAAKKAGVSEAQLKSIDNYESSEVFTAEEKAVLSFAEEVTKTTRVQKPTMQELKKSLNEKQLVSLAAAVALANFTNRINHSLDIELP